MINASKSQNGSAIVYVFIGIILFAILMLAFVRGLKQSSSGGDTDTKTARVAASEIANYAKTVERAVNKMLMNRISESDLGFTNAVTTLDASGLALYTGNPNCAAATCQIFDTGGGKVKPLALPPSYLIDNSALLATDPMAGAIFPNVVTIDSLGTAEPDLVLSFYGLTEPVCIAINDMFGVENPSGHPPVENTTAAGDMFTGSFNSSTTLGDDVTDLANRSDFCYNPSANNLIYVYQHVLIAR